jgi:hypothetical protein
MAIGGGGWSLEEEAERSIARNRSRESWAQEKRRSDLWISSPLSTPATGNQHMRHLVSALPKQVYPLTNRGSRACPSVNKSQKTGETGMRRCSIPRNPSWLCATSCRFRNHGHDCLSPRVSCGAVMNRCLGNAKQNVTVPTLHISTLP